MSTCWFSASKRFAAVVRCGSIFSYDWATHHTPSTLHPSRTWTLPAEPPLRDPPAFHPLCTSLTLPPVTAPAGPDSWMGSNMMGPPAMMNPLMRQAKMKLSEAPPAGCDQDALKLFVGNIPRSYTEEQLQPIFESMGKVVELVVVRDRATHESKGSAFVWCAPTTLATAQRSLAGHTRSHQSRAGAGYPMLQATHL